MKEPIVDEISVQDYSFNNSKNNPQDSLDLESQAIELLIKIEKAYSKNHEKYFAQADSTISILIKNKKHEKALPIALDLYHATKFNINLNKKPAFIHQLKTTTYLYIILGQYKEGLLFHKKFMKVIRRKKFSDYPAYLNDLNDLNYLLVKIGSYKIAMPLCQKTISMAKKNIPLNKTNYINSLINQANLFSNIGRFQDAMSLYLDAAGHLSKKTIENTKNIQANIHMNEEIIPNFLGNLYHQLDKDSSTQKTYALVLNNLANLHAIHGNYKQANNLYLESIDILHMHGTPKYYGNILSNLALLYLKMGNFEDAETQCNIALDFLLKSVGNKHEYYGAATSVLASIYQKTKRNSAALELYETSLPIINKSIGKNHTNYSIYLKKLASLYESMGMLEEAFNQFKNYEKINHLVLNDQIRFIAGSLQNTWLNSPSMSFDRYKSMFLRDQSNLAFKKSIITHQINLNGFILDSRKELRNAIKNQGKKAKLLYTNWINERIWMTEQLCLPRHLQNLEVPTKKQELIELENKIADSIIKNQEDNKSIQLKNLQKKLAKNQTFILFDSFNYYNRNEKTDSTLYVAYIIHPTGEPNMVFLFEQKQLDNLFATKASNGLTEFYLTRGIKPANSPKEPNEKLFELIWKPIYPWLENTNTLIVNLSGSLHRINHGAIPVNNSSGRISDRFQIYYFSSVRNFIYRSSKEYGRRALLFGGLDYNNASKFVPRKKLKNNDQRSITGEQWKNLPGTALEVDSINNLLRRRQYSTTCLKKDKGIESEIKKFNGIPSPRIIHFATHGFFFPPPQSSDKPTFSTRSNIFEYSKDPLFRTGLILSGGNKTWHQNITEKGQDDGILTAEEISNLNLSRTELVVLSACETGLGDIQSNEGVYGLQRGFKMAGVKYLIISLWKVPDMATKEMMTSFYNHWLIKRETIRIAFQAAQLEMRLKYDDQPEKWAGFILIE